MKSRETAGLVSFTRMDRGTVDDRQLDLGPGAPADLGDDLAPENHSELGASVLRPYVAQHTYWMVLQHGLFQGYYYFGMTGKDTNARERHRGHPAYDMTVRFCADYDQLSFDPDYDTLGIDHFVPMVERLFEREPWGAQTTREWPAE